MRVVLLEDMPNLGFIGSEVEVKPGYARNFLIPRGLAIPAGSKGDLRRLQSKIASKKRKFKDEAAQIAEELSNKEIKMFLKMGEEGKVFGSIGTRDVARELSQLGYSVDRRRIRLNPDIIKTAGRHSATVRLHPEILVKIDVVVEYELASKEDKDKEGDAKKGESQGDVQGKKKAEEIIND